MRLVLPDALHARPANLLVRLVAQRAASVVLLKGTCRADARKILDVLSLGAAKGDEIEILAEGAGAAETIAAIAELVARNFDGDLVPEMASGAVSGIAIGRALLLPMREQTAERARGTPEEEEARLATAEAGALAELDALIGGLGPFERALFEPERGIIQEVAAGARARVSAGEACEEAIVSLTDCATTDLILDARARLLDALLDDAGVAQALERAGAGEEVVVVTGMLTPSLVARLPRTVRGIVAVDDEPDAGLVRTSHAAILARGRELPLALVMSHVAMAIAEGETVVVDTTVSPAKVWVSPSASLLEDARARGARHRGADAAEVTSAIESASRELGIAFLVNVGSLHDRVPGGVVGVGLLRTELLFAGRASAPSERDQIVALLAVARAARGGVVTVRLWDAGGDKPLPWLPARSPDARGVALLFEHPAILDAQLAAIARAAERASLRVLLPMTRSAGDVEEVRRRIPGVPVGAMIETPEAALDADAIAAGADFVCIGTNDLSALVLGVERSDAAQGLHPRVLALVARVVSSSHARGKRVTVCGELAADPRGAPILVGLGVDALSVASPRISVAATALAGMTLDDCRAAAREAARETP